jgi:hypothetical protein
MNANTSTPAYRVISIIALLQVGVVIGGTMFVAAMLKAKGYQGGEVPDSFFLPDALFVRQFGFVFLLLPLAWTFLAVFIARLGFHRGPVVIFLIGVASILLGIAGYVMLGMNPTVL